MDKLQTKLIEYIDKSISLEGMQPNKSQRYLKNATIHIPKKQYDDLLTKLLIIRGSTIDNNTNHKQQAKGYLDALNGFKKTLSKENLDELVVDLIDNISLRSLREYIREYKKYQSRVNEADVVISSLKDLTKQSPMLTTPSSYVNEVNKFVMHFCTEGFNKILISEDRTLIMRHKEDLQKFDMVLKYNKIMLNCNISYYGSGIVPTVSQPTNDLDEDF